MWENNWTTPFNHMRSGQDVGKQLDDASQSHEKWTRCGKTTGRRLSITKRVRKMWENNPDDASQSHRCVFVRKGVVIYIVYGQNPFQSLQSVAGLESSVRDTRVVKRA
ncbi:hypothetical protein ElyMa_006107400 [Elysia marginata]|uniref:Uncharacterized protein n=1 Tax=Elysia marginata TaxID=1093978 RepID=A0AAV4GT79_9GAST|nr:hypothetical protein ElyMa_006107400 [Elysia marginata]